jgi:hypothetical protein
VNLKHWLRVGLYFLVGSAVIPIFFILDIRFVTSLPADTADVKAVLPVLFIQVVLWSGAITAAGAHYESVYRQKTIETRR